VVSWFKFCFRVEQAMIEQKLLEWAAQRRYRIAWGPGAVVELVHREIAARRSGLEIDERFFEHELESLFTADVENSEGKTAVIVAVPRPAHLVHFYMDGKTFDAVLPPTYVRYRATFEDVRLDLVSSGLPGAQTELLAGPLKAVAGRLGLIFYGRNNVTYIAGLGSYFQLCGYVTDAELPEMELTEASLLPECEGCSICASACPTGAIAEDRVLLRAEKCLTFANENTGDWPAWVNPQMHNCLLGCLECQRACPKNPELPVEDTGVRFSAAETRLLLRNDLPEMSAGAENGIRSKLAWLGQPYAEPVLGRNLRALVKAAGAV
jgi:epoxyqueuosine reductase